MTRNNWREYLVGIFLLVAGLAYLLVQAISILRDHSSVTSEGNMIHINRYAFLNELRTYITITSCIAGGWLLLRQKKAGWIMALPMILLFTVIVLAGILSLFQMKVYDLVFYLALAAAGFMFFILSIHLSLRHKYAIIKKDWFLTVLLCTILGLFYFFLQ